MRSTRALISAACAAAALAAATPAAGAGGPGCEGDLPAPGAKLPTPSGEKLRFGIYPGGTAGQVGPPAPAKPDRQDRIDAALAMLRPAGGPFVVRLYLDNVLAGAAQRTATLDRARASIRHYSALGYLLEFAVRYQPPGGADVTGFAAAVRQVVATLAASPAVIDLQVGNEVNFTAAPDSSDGSYAGARDALIAGVLAGKDEVRRRHARLEIGMNWFYRTAPSSEDDFWSYLHAHGGPAFARALDYVALDAYPGTFFPPSTFPPPGNSLVNAMSLLRRCYLPEGGISSATPLQVHENGYPTGPGRSPETQRDVLREMVRTIDAYRHKYRVSDYRWFDLRDGDSSSPNFGQQYGLMLDDYSPKPAFGAYRDLVHSLSRRNPPCSPAARPASRFDFAHSHLTRRGVALRGRSAERGCRAAAIRSAGVFVARRLRDGRCRFLARGRSLGAPRSCRRPLFLIARGRAAWRLAVRVRLPRGLYEAGVRARDARGRVETARRGRNVMWVRLR
ncbi:MAG: hypothetical protein QOK31_99 [Solirubrobacteraceae bacterium]|nr:hypothetical protein [Solirubrobacteraceae bacterium]